MPSIMAKEKLQLNDTDAEYVYGPKFAFSLFAFYRW
jgi:hypothetical protein